MNKNSAFDSDTTMKTFFCVMHNKSLENLLIEPNYENPKEFAKSLEMAFSDLMDGKFKGGFYGAICISKDGTQHIHFVPTFEVTKRVKAVAKLFGNAHIEPMRGTKEEACDYIEKKGKYEEKGEKILAFFGNKDAVESNQGKRTDLQLGTQIDKGEITASSLNKYILDNARSEIQAKRIQSIFERTMREKYNSNNARNNMQVIYVYGKSGEGKTQGVYERYTDIFRANVSEKTSFPFNGYYGQKTLLLDELRPGIFKPAELFSLLDTHPLNLDVKHGQFIACYDTVVIATAYPFEKWFTDETYENNDNLLQQFRRRITKLYRAEKGQWIDLNYQWNNDTKKANWNDESQWLNCDTTDSIPFLTE